VGLDTRLSIWNSAQDAGEKYRPAPLLVEYVKAGRLGRKAGRGIRVIQMGETVGESRFLTGLGPGFGMTNDNDFVRAKPSSHRAVVLRRSLSRPGLRRFLLQFLLMATSTWKLFADAGGSDQVFELQATLARLAAGRILRRRRRTGSASPMPNKNCD